MVKRIRSGTERKEAALTEFFGYQLERIIDPAMLEPDSIPLVKYKRFAVSVEVLVRPNRPEPYQGRLAKSDCCSHTRGSRRRR